MTHIGHGRGLAALLTLTLSACGGASATAGTAGADPPPAAPALTVMVVSDPATIGTYVPSPAGVSVGDTVEWKFVDQNPHSVSADDSSFDSTPRSRGKTFTFTFTRAGTVNYHCSIHPEMHGTIVVSHA